MARTQIVAVTTNAMPDDRAICLAAGMDGDTRKPVSPQGLMAIMDAALQGHLNAPEPTAIAHREPAPPAPHRPVAADDLDIEKLRRRLDGDEATLRQLALAMQTNPHARLLSLQAVLTERHAESAVAHVHGLRGSLGSTTAERGARLAKGLELAASARDWTLFGRALPLVAKEARAIHAGLVDVLSAPMPPAG